MTRTILICLLGLLLFSCGSGDGNGPAESWRLTSVYSPQLDILEEGSDLSYQENLYFFPNGTFLKRRFMDAERYEARGRYSRVVQDGLQVYRVEYEENSLIVFNCFGGLTEHFIVESPGLVQRDGIPCDGSEYRYEEDGFIPE